MDWGDITEEYNGTTHAGLVKLKFLNGERAGETVDYPEEDYWTYDTGKYVYYLDTGDNFTVVWNRVGPAPGKYTITPTYSFDTDKTDNYEVSLTGTSLTIEEAELKITTKTASKAYDGSPLTSTEVTISGLAGGETVTATATGTITDVGSVKNNYTIDWGTTNKNNYKVTETIGTLTVEPLILNISLGSPITNYDGSPHGGYPTLTYGNGDKKGETLSFHDVESADLGGGFAVNYAPAGDDMLHVVGYGDGPDAGTYTLVCNTSFTSGKAGNYKVNVTDNTLTINKREAIVYTGSAEKYYDGKALTNTSATDNYVSGLLSHEFATVTATGSIREAGSTENTYTIDWGSTNPDNYKLTEKLGILTVKVYDDPVTISTPSATKTYDGTRIDTSTVTVTGLPSGFTCEAYTGGMYAKVDAGTYENDLHDMYYTDTDEDGNMYAGWRYYAIYDASENDVTKAFTNVKTELGTLTIKQATAVVTTGSAEGPSGTMYPVTSDEASITGLADTDKPYVTITATGKQNSVGSSDNTYSIQWGTTEHPVNSENYKIEEHLGTLTMYNAALTPPVGSAVPSKKGTTDDQSDNPADTGSAQEKDTKTGNDDGNAASDQAGDGSEKSEQAADKPDQTSENTDTKSDQSEQASENADSKEDQPEQASENTDPKEDQPEQASENADSKEDQPDRTSESSEKSSDASKEPAKESSEEAKKDPSEESKKDTSEESKKESSEESKKSEKKDARKDSDDGNEAAPAEVPAASEKKDQKDSEE